MSFLELYGVEKAYGRGPRRLEVVKNLHFEVERGEFAAILGPSGAGKTTLISLMAGLTSPDAGSVRLAGLPVDAPGPDRGVVFQNYSLLPWMTVFENVALAVDHVFSSWEEGKRRAHTERAIALVNLAKARDKRPRELSGGMRQRVALARALATNPEVLLMDEPLSALDALTRANLQDEIERIWEEEKKTVVLVTNDVDEAILLADRVFVLSAGPRATLAPPISVDLPRPRSRKSVNHDREFARVKGAVIEALLKGHTPVGAATRGAKEASPIAAIEASA